MHIHTSFTAAGYQLKQILSLRPPSSNAATGWGHDSCQVDGVSWFIAAITFILPNQPGTRSLMNLWLFITWGQAFFRFTSLVFSPVAPSDAAHASMNIFLDHSSVFHQRNSEKFSFSFEYLTASKISPPHPTEALCKFTELTQQDFYYRRLKLDPLFRLLETM